MKTRTDPKQRGEHPVFVDDQNRAEVLGVTPGHWADRLLKDLDAEDLDAEGTHAPEEAAPTRPWSGAVWVGIGVVFGASVGGRVNTLLDLGLQVCFALALVGTADYFWPRKDAQ